MRPLPLGLFALVSASPLALIGLAAIAGGVWPWLALLYMALAAVMLDALIPWVAGDREGDDFPAADGLLIALGAAGLALLPLATWAIAGTSAPDPGQRVALFLACGLWFGQVGHPAAHEMIHRGGPLHGLGVALYAALLFGHHASAHRLVHHRFVATPQDPNSAPEGEGFYRFLRRAWTGSFLAGLHAENALRARDPNRKAWPPHPYVFYLGGAALGLLAGWLIAGPAGALVWLGLGLHMGVQVLLSDYVQHYGLRRTIGPDGRPEPVTQAHSWNAPHWYSSALTLNATRHSDHHTHPARPFPALRLATDAPRLPWPLPVAAVMALFPRLWRRRMRRALAALPATGR